MKADKRARLKAAGWAVGDAGAARDWWPGGEGRMGRLRCVFVPSLGYKNYVSEKQRACGNLFCRGQYSVARLANEHRRCVML